MSLSVEQQQLVDTIEDYFRLLQKTQTNLKKCPKQRMTKGYIEAKIKCIEGYWQMFLSAHHNLAKCTPKCKRNEVTYFVNDDYFLVEDLYTCLIGDLSDMLSSSLQLPSNSMQVDNKCEQSVTLPRISLPHFMGCYESWSSYRDLFISLVHNNTSLTKVQKLHYLKSSVGGEPEVLLKHINVTDANYEQAWDLLTKRYGNRRLIVNSVLQRLFNQKKITSQSSSHLKSILDTTTQCLNNLKNEDVPTDNWDQLIIYLVVQKFDSDTHRSWEEYSYNEDSNKLPTWTEMKMFLETKFRTLEMVNPVAIKERTINKPKSFHVTSVEEKNTVAPPTKRCSMCKEGHTLCHCKEFCSLQPTERSDFVKKNRLCYNCLTAGHSVMRCRIPISCRVCNYRHHTLLHESVTDKQTDNMNTHHNEVEEDEQNLEHDDQPDVAVSTFFASEKSTALLATALVTVKNDQGHSTILRALVDQGSQANFISERAAQLLKVKRFPSKGTITGVGSTQTTVKHMIQVELHSNNANDNFNLSINAYVMPTRLTSQLPSKSIVSTHNWPHLRDLTLADPSFHSPGRIDMLLGVEVCAHIFKPEIIKGPPGSPCAQNTSLGWILFGRIQTPESVEPNILVMHHQINIDDMLKTLWEVDTDGKRILTNEEDECERIYRDTHTRDEEGRYVVKLPFKTRKPQSPEGNTKEGAMKRLAHLERRFSKNDNLRKEYVKAIEEYKELKHMEEIPKAEINNPAVYLPHHAVLKDDSETTKVRPVFDASHKGTNNISLNEELLTGPQLQEDMRSLVMRWRLKKVAFIADVQKMYRQILVVKEDTDYQRILWRKKTTDIVKEYRLLRVTFGTASAPYLAVRTLHQVADDEGTHHPKAAATIKQDFYMDDLISGQDTVDKAVEIAKNVSAILRKGGFILQKWASNNAEFLKEFPPDELSSHVNIDIKLDGLIKTLGLSWNMGEDILEYNLKLPCLPDVITKRKILGEVQRLFDPLGFLAPALVPAKIMIQKLWLQGISWDEEVDLETKEEWLEIRRSLESVKFIKIDRWLQSTEEKFRDITIHGYCDASTKAYGAVAYLRIQGDDGQYRTGIIAARTKVAPLKSLSLPRLELCGAVLLSKLLKHVSEATRIPVNQIFCWTDSSIVLSWLQGDPNRWQTFVRNRVITILDNIGNKWYHIQSKHNPADVASRGMLASELKNCTLWWHGPEHLKQKEINMERLVKENTELEKRKTVNTYLNLNENKNTSILGKLDCFHNLTELLRTITLAKRFLKFKKIKNLSFTSAIKTEEMEDALKTCIQITQQETFYEEIKDLKEQNKVKNRSNLKRLNPFLDANDILRVGGRIKHCDVEYDRKHPIILDNKNALTSLIVAEAHKKTLHGTVQQMLNFLRSRYWILKVKNLVRVYIHRCIVCARINAKPCAQLMADLPEVRLKPARPFLRSGLDFAGPYDVLMSKGRGAKTYKCYIAIFVCMATKAIHLELAGDMTTEAFLGAFRRFVARRGRCSDLWSDQGRTFVGANKELKEAFEEARLEFGNEIADLLGSEGTQWHFIPAYSPNFGGLWEAGVKSLKHHLKRVLQTHLTFEEMTTLLCQIEACLNSRPLYPIDDTDVNNVHVLTPGHFLIGESPVTAPYPSLKDITLNSLSRWQLTQRLLSNFWEQWQQQYLHRLQQRPKWLSKQKEMDIGQIVIIKTEGLPPSKWHLGRVVDKHPGPDGCTRVYSVKSGNNIVKRSVSKLCFIPVND